MKYTPIRVSNLRGDQPIGFDAYVKVSNKFVLYCREGDSFENQRLERLKSKKLNLMYIRKEQENLYQKYISKNIEKAYSARSDTPLDVKAQIILGAIQSAIEDLVEDLSNEAYYKNLIIAAQRLNDFLQKEEKALQALLSVKNYEFNVSQHSAQVAALFLSLLSETDYFNTRPMQVPIATVGVFLHDVEHFYNHLNLSQGHETLSEQEKQIYHRHSIRGAEQIKAYHFYDPLVFTLVEQHEETIDGTGPLKIKEKDHNVFTPYLLVANTFDRYLQLYQIDAKEALRRILIEKMGVLSLDVMKNLQDVLKKKTLID